MKIDFKLTLEKLIILNRLLSFYDTVNFHALDKAVKSKFALRMEARKILIKKTLSAPRVVEFKITMPYYVAEEFYNFLVEKLTDNFDAFEANFLEMLRNNLHQKLL